MTLRPHPKRRPLRDPKYLAWIRTQPCVLSQWCIDRAMNDIHAHHVPEHGHASVGQKVSDRRTVPLCRIGHSTYHQIGRVYFEDRYMVNLEREIERLNREYDALFPERKVSKPRKERQRTPQIKSVLIQCSCSQSHTVPAGKLVQQKNEYRFYCQVLKDYVLAKMKRSA